MLPKVIIHVETSLDGCVDNITPHLDTYYRIARQFKEDVTLVGSETLLRAIPLGQTKETKDDAEMHVFENQGIIKEDLPMLAAVDARGRVKNLHQWRTKPYWKDVIALCTNTTPKNYLDYLTSRNIEYITTFGDHVDLESALEILEHQWGVKTIRVESGGTLSGVLLRAGLVDEVSVLVNPELIGGITPGSFFRSADGQDRSLYQAIDLELEHLERLEDDLVWLRYKVKK